MCRDKEINNLPVYTIKYQRKAQCFIFSQDGILRNVGDQMPHTHYAYKVSLEKIYREQGGTLLKDLLATYICFHSKIRSEARPNKRYTHTVTCFLRTTIQFTLETPWRSQNVLSNTLKNLGANIHMQLNTVFNL